MELSVHRWGRGPRRALLVHGISSNGAGWWRMGPALAALGYEVVAPDLRGHGDTGPGPSYTLAEHAADLLELGSGWDLALGHSMGGAVVTLAALTGQDFARRVVLEDPAIVIPNTTAALDWLLAPFAGNITPDSVATKNPAWHPEDARIKAEALLQSGPEVVEQTMADNATWNVVEALLTIEVPTLLVGADPDNGAIVPVALGKSLAASNPAVTYVTVPGGSHSIHRDEFDAFLEVVGPFVA